MRPAPVERPLTARSVVASTLLGVRPPRLPTSILVRSGALFGIAEGTTRVALSRMVGAGELEPDGDGYRLAGHLLTRQARQARSVAGPPEAWDGTWRMAVVTAESRTAAERAELRSAAAQLRLAEQREGVWLRPDNLPAGELPEAEAVLGRQCRRFDARPADDPARLAASLWDLDGWTARAAELLDRMAVLRPRLDAHDLDALPEAFVASAAVLRHLQADPLLPEDLLPPAWPGPELRQAFDGYQRAFAGVWGDWYRAQRAAS